MNRLLILLAFVSTSLFAQQLPSFADLAAQIGPSVVNIQTAGKTEELANTEEYKRFFKKYGIPEPAPKKIPEAERPLGVGSGFIWSSDGYVLTNAHVVADAAEVLITLTDGREFKARVVGSDKRSDVALVKIETRSLPAVRIGNSDRTRVGDWVMAIGSPFGFENTVTAGIISAKQRDTGDLLPLIQSDVAINPGNSGGPLINLQGEVIGINSQIYSKSGGYQGISFSIPINEVMRVADQLRATGKIIRGRIGIMIASPDRTEALIQPKGVLVSAIDAEGPAARSSLRKDDLILLYNGIEITKYSDLPRLVSGTAPGTRIILRVVRSGKTIDVPVVIGSDQ